MVKTLCCLMLLLTAGTAFGEDSDLLRNASFEIPLDPENWGCDQPAHWIRWGNWMNRETGWAPTRDGECLVGFHHFRLKGEDNAGFYQDVRDAEKNKLYTFSIFTWVDKEFNGEQIELQLHSYHGGSVLTTAVHRASRIPVNQWVPLSVSGSPPEDGLRVMVVVEPKTGGKFCKGAVKFDAASLVKEN